MKKEQPFLSKSKDSFTFNETYSLRQYQIGLIEELENNKYAMKYKNRFLEEIQQVELFIKWKEMVNLV